MQPVEDKNTFPVAERVKSSRLIKEIMDDNRSIYDYPIKCYYRITDAGELALSQLAVMVPKKRFHHAVDRNRIKRLMRECYRLHKHQLRLPEGKCCQMCWISVAKEMPDCESVAKAVQTLFQQINTQLT